MKLSAISSSAAGTVTKEEVEKNAHRLDSMIEDFNMKQMKEHDAKKERDAKEYHIMDDYMTILTQLHKT